MKGKGKRRADNDRDAKFYEDREKRRYEGKKRVPMLTFSHMP